MKKPNLSLAELCAKAAAILKTQPYFLLAYDVIGSRDFAKAHGYQKLHRCLYEFHAKINEEFGAFIVSQEIGIGRTLARFETILGDDGGAYFSDQNVIEPILALANQLPFKLRWVVAGDGWDKDADELLK